MNLSAGIKITRIEPGGLIDRAGLGTGFHVLRVNGREINDSLDFLFHAAEPEIEIDFTDRQGHPGSVLIEREYGAGLGVDFEPFRVRVCRNKCPFCFVYQLPKGLRQTLYFKDEDYRLSFLYGHYITGTNLSEADFSRIFEFRLSPLYISVHATDTELRKKMLGRKTLEPIFPLFERFRENGIEFHGQIVLCPGWNDGQQLLDTIQDLSRYWPALRSIAVVPLGLTSYRERLPRMDVVTPEYAAQTIELLKPVQQDLKKRLGNSLVWLSDEFYLMSNTPLPVYRGRGTPQIENGVGMIHRFLKPWGRLEKKFPKQLAQPRRVGVLTGMLGGKILTEPAARLNRIGNLHLQLMPIENRLFGSGITVSGLLGGGDFLAAIRENPPCDYYLIPPNALRPWDDLFLDDVSLGELQQQAGAPVYALSGDVANICDAALGNAFYERAVDIERPNYEMRKLRVSA